MIAFLLDRVAAQAPVEVGRASPRDCHIPVSRLSARSGAIRPTIVGRLRLQNHAVLGTKRARRVKAQIAIVKDLRV